MAVSKFQMAQIREAPKAGTEQKIRDVQFADNPEVIEYKHQPIKAGTKGVFTKAANHFTINPLIRDPEAANREEQARIKALVHAQVAQLTADATKKGFLAGREAGLEEGRKQALEASTEKLAPHVALLEKLFGEIEAMRDKLILSQKEAIAECVFEIARRIVLRELTTDKDYLTRLSIGVIESVDAKESVTLLISKQDAILVDTLTKQLTDFFSGLRQIKVVPSDQVPSSGVILETEFSRIDATLETQFERMHEALVGGVKESL